MTESSQDWQNVWLTYSKMAEGSRSTSPQQLPLDGVLSSANHEEFGMALHGQLYLVMSRLQISELS